ncbi:hypothetical protein [Streptomyces monashensis]|uniref:Gram-positive cocci surface proteins LPxTG domain-containing protein n=1 Tax=Streptomyces monashensis TaxID=1678012 RepID=A0A1S2QIG3_9ACTN|nr:hypothetical protein [Streptomyces monashensis]OIK05932.1 hypothetical protein BIV23_10320 [Streptomyces monashensis]
MTPWLRLTLRSIRLLLALAVTAALSAYGTGTAYALPVCAADPGPGTAAGQNRPHHSGSGHAKHPGHAAQPSGSGSSNGSVSGRPERPGNRPGDPDHGDRGSRASPSAAASPASIPSGSSSASHHPGAADPTRAGSLAGEGRLRPGRPDGPAAEVEGGDATVPTRAPGTGRSEEPETADLPVVTPTASDASGESGHGRTPARHAAPQGETATEPVLQLLPLGSGLVLIGLGLAFLGLRLRRG